MPITQSQANFTKHQDPRLPVLASATYTLLDVLWDDDYESFALVNPSEDPEGTAMLLELNREVVQRNIRPLPAVVITRTRANGWRDYPVPGNTTPEAWGLVDALWMHFAGEG